MPPLLSPYDRTRPSLQSTSNYSSRQSINSTMRSTYTESKNIFILTNISPLETTKQANLVFNNVSYTISTGGIFGKKKELQLLKNVSGVVSPGELCAVMGCSGAGKFNFKSEFCDNLPYFDNGIR